MKSNSTNLEQYIQENRPAFDQADPGAHCWAVIERSLARSVQPGSVEQFILFNRASFDTANPPEHLWRAIEGQLNTAATPSISLEQFIQQHREAFDAETPDLRVWAGVDQAVPKQLESKIVRMPWRHTLLRIAASIALLIGGVGIGIWYAGRAQQTSPGMPMSALSAEYAELEQYYQRDIRSKEEKLATFSAYRDSDVNDDLEQMDRVMVELREELAQVPPGNREQVVRAMIENYKAKAAILERVLEHIEQQQPATTNSGNHAVKKI